MSLIDKLSLVILILTLGAQILYRRSFWFTPTPERPPDLESEREASSARLVWGFTRHFFRKENFSKFLRYIWIISVVAILGILTYWATLQYQLWESSEFTKHLLPPYQSFGFFYSYVGKRFFAPWLISLLFAIVISRVSKLLNKKYGERFFENEEIELIAFGVFLVGYPGFFIYLPLLLVVYLVLQIINNIRAVFSSQGIKNVSEEPAYSRRLSAYYLWIPLAILAIIIKVWLFPLMGLQHYLGGFAI